MANFVVVTGGVLSGLGKGVVTSSISLLLKSQGYKVSPVKIDPYINVDAGTMRPTEHGEVWVTCDGGETDQDFGNYERFIDEDIPRLNSITTGQVYLSLIKKERNLEFDGKCVEVIPHIPMEVISRLDKIAEEQKSDFVVIEVGGTVGDYQSVVFLEAMRRMQMEGRSIAFVHVVYLPLPTNIGEMKTKPAQHSVRDLNAAGIKPDFIVARANMHIDDVRREKLSVFSGLKEESIISAPDLDFVYEQPLILEKQNFPKKLLARFGLQYRDSGLMRTWREYTKKAKSAKKKVKIGIIGKYLDIGDFSLEDSYISVVQAVKHACWQNNAKPQIVWIDSKQLEQDKENVKQLDYLDGIIIPGGFGNSGVEGKIKAISYARKNNIPFLGLCYGFQLALVEFARNACGLRNANSTEIDPDTPYPVIDILPEQKEKLKKKDYGGTMRLGNHEALLKKGTLVHSLYGKVKVTERHRHRYEANPEYIRLLEEKGLIFSGKSPSGRLMEFLELPGHRFFCATQAHPEFTSRPLRPTPMFAGFTDACLKRTSG